MNRKHDINTNIFIDTLVGILMMFSQIACAFVYVCEPANRQTVSYLPHLSMLI